MPERSTIAQKVQLGVEATQGTAVAANRRLLATSIVPGPELDFSQFRPAGLLWPGINSLNKEWSESDIEGQGSYTDIVYLLSGLFGAATITSPDATNAPSARQWEFAPSSSGGITPVSYTVEVGDANFAEQIPGLIVNGLSMDIDRDGGIEVGGSAFARKVATGATLTASPTEIAAIPMQPTEVSIYVDAPGATPDTALGTTKLTRVFSTGFDIDDRYGMVWVLDAAQGSYVATVEGEPSGSVTLNVEADSVGMGLLDTARTGATRMIRIETVGALIGGTTYYRFTADFAGKITEVGDREDTDNVQTIPYTFGIFHDATWGRAVRFRVINTLASL